MASSSSGGGSADKTVNKVALCSAIFAGFAYIGYGLVRTSFHRRRRERDVSYPEGEARIFFRRLSQSCQTDSLLGNLDLSSTTGGRIVLRPLSVQERIRELNFRARHFADTMLALQGKSLSSTSSSHGPRSLQCSPWSSPRILSPVDVRQFIASRSSDNLSLVPVNSLLPSPAKRRFSKSKGGLLSKKGPDVIVGAQQQGEHSGAGGADAGDKSIEDISEELKEKLENLSLKGRAMDPYESKTLVALLYATDEGILERTLITIANLATFEINQNNLREAGCLPKLQNLLCHPKYEIRLATIRCIGNMSLNEHNQREMNMFVPMLMTFVMEYGHGNGGNGSPPGQQPQQQVPGASSSTAAAGGSSREEMTEAVLTTLSNLAVLPNWHSEFCPYLHSLFKLFDSTHIQDSLPVQLQTLKLLVNLSTSSDIQVIGALLGSPAPTRLLYLLSPESNSHVEILLRVVTLIANLVVSTKEYQINPIIHLQQQDKAPSPETMYAALFGINNLDRLKEKSEYLLGNHSDEDVRIQSRRLHNALIKAASHSQSQSAGAATSL